MIPILFAENATQFNTNGLGRLADAIYCKVDEERNGIYELEMSYPISGQHYEDIKIRSIVVVKPSANANIQPFRIYKITKPINGKVTIYAQHISYDLTKNVCMPFTVTASGTACNTALQGLKTNAVESCPFDFWTDVTTVASYDQKIPGSIRQRLGGTQGSILDQFGGEYEWDGYTVKLWKNRGQERDITLRYGKNITDLEQEENIANTVTGIVPYWTNTDNSDSLFLTEKAVYSPNVDKYSTRLTVPMDFSSEWEEKPTQEQLRNKATVYVNQSGFGLPKVSIKLSFINLADTEEYKELLPMQELSLCDEIEVQFERLDINTTAKVVKTTYDVLSERYESIEVGSLKSTLAMTINDMNASTIATIEESSRRVFTDTEDFVDNATAWLTSSGGYVVATRNADGSWKELLFMDTNDVTTAHNVLRINENGIGFSSSGVSGPYKQGWTLDGNILIGGSNASGLTVYKRVNGVDTVLFQVDPSKIIWNAPNSSMDANGKITASDATLSGKFTSMGTNDDLVIEDGSIKAYVGSTLKGKINLSQNGDVDIFSSQDILLAPDDSLFINADNIVHIETDDNDTFIDMRNGDMELKCDDLYINQRTGASGNCWVKHDVDSDTWYQLTFENGICVGGLD